MPEVRVPGPPGRLPTHPPHDAGGNQRRVAVRAPPHHPPPERWPRAPPAPRVATRLVGPPHRLRPERRRDVALPFQRAVATYGRIRPRLDCPRRVHVRPEDPHL